MMADRSRKTAGQAVLGVTLAGSVLLAGNAFAMTELAQGYAAVATEPPAGGKIPPPAEQPAPVDKQSSTDHRHAEGKCGAETASQQKSGASQAEGQPAKDDSAADKGMEGKCGEGKCGAGI